VKAIGHGRILFRLLEEGLKRVVTTHEVTFGEAQPSEPFKRAESFHVWRLIRTDHPIEHFGRFLKLTRDDVAMSQTAVSRPRACAAASYVGACPDQMLFGG
jgi:hypothetical protein